VPARLLRGHRHPTAASAFIQPASVLAHARVHLRLHSFNIRTVFRIDARDARVKKHAAVARGLALELKSQMEVAIRFFGRQVAILVGGAFAQDSALLDDPLFFPIVLPARQIFPVEKRDPPPCGGAFATTATTTSTTEARKAPILLTVKSPSLLIEKSEGLAGRNLSQIQRSTCLFPSIALGFSECLAGILSARWFPPLPDRGCTASSGLSRRTDKAAGTMCSGRVANR